MSNATQEDVLHIDPVRMNLVNRIASGSIAQGNLAFAGGLLLQGQWVGNGMVKGSLVVWHDALLTGHFKIEDDLYCLCYLAANKHLKKYGSVAAMEAEVLYQNPHLKHIFNNSTLFVEAAICDKVITLLSL